MFHKSLPDWFIPLYSKVNQTGNTLIEYSIVGTCIAIVAIVGLKALSGDLNDWFRGVKQDMHSNIQATAVASSKATQAKSAYEKSQALKKAQANASQLLSTCSSGQVCSTVSAYNPAQTVGANGIDLVDQYADIIKRLANKVHNMANSDLTFALMLDDLAADGHNVAGDERAVLTMYAQYGSSFDFSIQDRYAATLNRAVEYLNQNSHLLSEQDSNDLRIASDNITQQIKDFLGNSDPRAVTNSSINGKFTDAGGNQGATYVDTQASNACKTGGLNCQ